MLSIAICDNDPHDLTISKDATRAFFQQSYKTLRYSLTTFFSGAELSASVQSKKIHDIYILDVDLAEQRNGLFYASLIHSLSPSALIVFLSSYQKYALHGYRSGAIRYIYKPWMDKELPEALDYAVKKYLESDSQRIMIRNNLDCRNILYSEIVYVIKDVRLIRIILSSGDVIQSNQGIKQFFTSLNDPRFLFIDKGVFVNLDYVERAVGKEVKLIGVDCPLPVSRRCASVLKKELIHFLSSKQL